ncbi:MAG: hypothetical protein TEF_17320 [Rhizobiales bacterium NRL2]|jgi:DNA-binding MarR family transcriptional regulator|nr:MAG: hypothetical protein TEF_17320 [Rhizobiales bacterium NRL2]
MSRAAQDQNLHLDDYFPYLLNRAGSRIAEAFSAETRRRGVSLQMWRVLAAVNDRGPLRMGELSEATSIEGSTLTRLVQQMERKGLVERVRRDADQRVVRVVRTDAGRRIAAELIPLAMDYEARALEGLGAEEVARLKTLLRRVYANMDRQAR